MPSFQFLSSIAPVGLAIGLAVTSGTIGAQMIPAKTGFTLVQTQGMDRRQDRRDDRQDDRTDRRGDRQDCRQDEGAAGKDKRDCKQEERQERNQDG